MICRPDVRPTEVIVDKAALDMVMDMFAKWREDHDEGWGYDISVAIVKVIDAPTWSDDRPTYHHRNGESEPPSVEGWYWIVGDTDNNYPVPNVLPPFCAEFNRAIGDTGYWTIGEYLYVPMLETATYYGPIPMPKGVAE